MPVNKPQKIPKVNQNKFIVIMLNRVKPIQNKTYTIMEDQKHITFIILTYRFIEHD